MLYLPFKPESPLTERLRFLTDVLEHKDGSEQRVNLRTCPRVEFDFTLLLTDAERQILENTLFNNMAALVKVPVWSEPTLLNAARPSGSSALTVDYLPYSSIRAGDEIVLWLDSDTYENKIVGSLGASTINLTTPTAHDWPLNCEVFPVRNANLQDNLRVSRYKVGITQYQFTAAMVDTKLDIADASAFASFNSKVVLDDANAVDTTAQEAWSGKTYITDSITGKWSTASPWPNARRASTKGFITQTRQRLWQIRQMLFALRGRQTSFYLPTFAQDMTASSNITNATTTLAVVNSGYTSQTQHRRPRDVIRVVLFDGTSYTRTVTDAVETSLTVETLTVDTPWDVDINMLDIDRIEILEKVRLDSDDITIVHKNSNGSASVSFPVRSVLDFGFYLPVLGL